MTKNELKAALDLAGIAYAKKANLETMQGLYHEHALGIAQKSAVAEDHSIKPGAPLNSDELAAYTDGMGHATVAELDCPHCGIHLSNGLIHVDDESMRPQGAISISSGQSYRDDRDPAFEAGEWKCMACGGHFGERVVYADVTEGLKIEKDRPSQNGVTRPSIGGKCRAIWDALDAYRTETGEVPTSKTVKELAADESWNPNNASIEFYNWRKFHGIQGRAAKQSEA